MLGCRVQSSEMLGCSTPRFVRRISCDSCRVRAPDARDAVIHALIVRARFDLVFHAPLALPRLPLLSAATRRTAWVSLQTPRWRLRVAGHHVGRPPNHALDHIFVLSWLTAETLCARSPRRCPPSHRTARRGGCPRVSCFGTGCAWAKSTCCLCPRSFSFAAHRGSQRAHRSSAWTYRVRLALKCSCSTSSGSGYARYVTDAPWRSPMSVEGPSQRNIFALGWAGEHSGPRAASKAHRPEWLEDKQGCVRHAPLWRNRETVLGDGKLVLRMGGSMLGLGLG